jgi:hypothetical protein
MESEQGKFFVRKYRPSLVEYLNERVGPKFDPPINFTIRYVCVCLSVCVCVCVSCVT